MDKDQHIKEMSFVSIATGGEEATTLSEANQVAIAHGDKPLVLPDEAAKAKLIAAAPDLLHASQYALALLFEINELITEDERSELKYDPQDIIDTLGNALAKAED